MKQKAWLPVLITAMGMIGMVFTSCEPEEIMSDQDKAAAALESDYLFSSQQEVHVCIDKFLPHDAQEKAAVIPSRLWRVGQTIRVRFLDGDPFVHGKVMHFAKMWESHANVRLEQVTKGAADIRISFDTEDGSWSYIGKDALYMHADSATMNFGWFNSRTADVEFRRTTLHEFGHALGMIHEHQNPVAGIPWDTAKVYAYYTKAPNNWTREDVDHNIFERYSKYQTQFCRYDPKSIMHYSVPAALTIGNFYIGNNTNLSDEDKQFVEKMYPFSGLRGSLKCKPYGLPPASSARSINITTK